MQPPTTIDGIQVIRNNQFGHGPTMFLRRLRDPLECEVVRESEYALQLLEPDDVTGAPRYREIEHFTEAGHPVAWVGYDDDDPLPNLEQVPLDLWRRDQLFRYATDHDVELRALPPKWTRVHLLDLIARTERGEAIAILPGAGPEAPDRGGAPTRTQGDDAPPAVAGLVATKTYAERTVRELLADCEERGIVTNSSQSKTALIEALVDWDEEHRGL